MKHVHTLLNRAGFTYKTGELHTVDAKALMLGLVFEQAGITASSMQDKLGGKLLHFRRSNAVAASSPEAENISFNRLINDLIRNDLIKIYMLPSFDAQGGEGHLYIESRFGEAPVTRKAISADETDTINGIAKEGKNLICMPESDGEHSPEVRFFITDKGEQEYYKISGYEKERDPMKRAQQSAAMR